MENLKFRVCVTSLLGHLPSWLLYIGYGVLTYCLTQNEYHIRIGVQFTNVKRLILELITVCIYNVTNYLLPKDICLVNCSVFANLKSVNYKKMWFLFSE